MRILLVTARYRPHRGGLETVVCHLAEEFLRRGHEVQIVTNRYPRSLPACEQLDGVLVRRFHFILPEAMHLRNSRPDLWLAGLWYRNFTQRNLRALINRFKPDVINSHYLNETAELTGLALGSTPWVISFHGGDVEGEPCLSHERRQRFTRLAHQANAFTACSASLARNAVSLEPSLEGKTDLIHNGVDVDRFSSAQPSSFAPPYILAVGQLVAHKGFDLLIRAFAPLAAKYSSVQLIIAGEGSYRPQLELLCDEYGLAGRVILWGRADEAQVACLMAGSLFVAMPSQKEPFGIVALEAMAARKSVLASPVGGLPEFLPCPPNRLVPRKLTDWENALDEWISLALAGDLSVSENYSAALDFDWPRVAGRNCWI
jgi:glycosyltransferase involved in cell wall biosynthesis